MDIKEAVKQFGGRRDTVRVGDRVLLEESNSDQGHFVILCEVTAVSATTATVKRLWTYYLSGNQFPSDGSETVESLDTFKKPISLRIQDAKEFWEWFVARWKSDEAKYGDS